MSVPQNEGHSGLIQRVTAWLDANSGWLGWVAIVSAIIFVASLLAAPWFLARLPADYFAERDQPPKSVYVHSVLGIVVQLSRNVVGILLILAGIAMLVLPGQGLLTVAAGIMLMDFPGKRQWLRRIISRPAVLRVVNWLRERHGKPPLEL